MPAGEKIDLNYARQLAQNYADTKLGTLLPSNDTKSVWFSSPIILKALGLDPNISTGGVTGIRIYFGAYKQETGYPRNAADQDKLTLIMVPTGVNEIIIDRGGIKEGAFLDNIDEGPGGGKIQPSYPVGPANDSNSITNEGQMMPPPAGGIAPGLLNW